MNISRSFAETLPVVLPTHLSADPTATRLVPENQVQGIFGVANQGVRNTGMKRAYPNFSDLSFPQGQMACVWGNDVLPEALE